MDIFSYLYGLVVSFLTDAPVVTTATVPMVTPLPLITNISSTFTSQVSLHLTYNNKFLCGGTIIDSNFIVTIAHCMYYSWGGILPPLIVKVLAGRTSLKENGVYSYDIESILFHDDFNGTLSYDLALIQTKSTLNFTTDLKKSAIGTARSSYEKCSVTGWNKISENLQAISVKLVNCSQVQDFEVVCAQAKQMNEPLCNLTLGSSLICDNELIGILSSGSYCEVTNQTATFQNLSYSVKWLTVNGVTGLNYNSSALSNQMPSTLSSIVRTTLNITSNTTSINSTSITAGISNTTTPMIVSNNTISATTAPTTSIVNTTNIANGSITTPQASQVSLYLSYNNQFLCGGTIIDSKSILTVAHCLYYSWGGVLPPVIVTIIGGRKSLNDTVYYRYEVDEIYFHASYNESTLDYDVALIQTKEAIQFRSDINKTELGKVPSRRNNCIATGWNKESEELKTVSVVLVNCSKENTSQRTLCARVQDAYTTLCYHSIGTSLICNDELIGILSSAPICTNANQTAVFQDLQYSADWLKSHNATRASATKLSFTYMVMVISVVSLSFL